MSNEAGKSSWIPELLLWLLMWAGSEESLVDETLDSVELATELRFIQL